MFVIERGSMERNVLGGRSTVVQLKKVLGEGDKSAMRFIYKDLGWIWFRAEESGRRSTTSECCGGDTSISAKFLC